MGKTLELPDQLYEAIQEKARTEHVEPAEVVRRAIQTERDADWLAYLRANGKTHSRPREGLCQARPFRRVKTKDGSLVSEQIIQDRI